MPRRADRGRGLRAIRPCAMRHGPVHTLPCGPPWMPMADALRLARRSRYPATERPSPLGRKRSEMGQEGMPLGAAGAPDGVNVGVPDGANIGAKGASAGWRPPPQPRVWRTDEVAARERFAYYREAICEAFMELAPEQGGDAPPLGRGRLRAAGRRGGQPGPGEPPSGQPDPHRDRPFGPPSATTSTSSSAPSAGSPRATATSRSRRARSASSTAAGPSRCATRWPPTCASLPSGCRTRRSTGWRDRGRASTG